MAEEDDIFPIGLSLAAACAHIERVAAQHALPAESVDLQAARRRILAHDVVAPRDVPPFANSAMDGFAVRGCDLPDSGTKSFRLIGEIFAGGREAPPITADTCVRITTGAPLPRAADTVVMKENTRTDGAVITVNAGTEAGANVRPAGEDFRAGQLALGRGCRLTPAQLGALASFGFDRVDVARQPRAILLTTGDELVAVGAQLGFAQIYDSNRYSLGAVIEESDTVLLRHERVRDDPQALRDALRHAGDEADIVISSGGVSAGEADYLPRLVAEIGQVHFWKVRIKPGMPFLCGRVGKALLCALPGNPVSGIATFLTLVRPALEAMRGAQIRREPLRARLQHALSKTHARTEFQRAHVHCDDQGVLLAASLRQQGSGMLRGVAEANALIVLPEAVREYAAGEVLEVLPLPGWSD
jgi:molybdopterin molybdotransferase